MTTIDTSKLAFGSLIQTSKGAKQLPCLYTNGESVVWQPCDFLEIPFEPSAFNDEMATRVTLCMTPTDAVSETVAALDAWIRETIVAQSPALLGTSMTPAQVAERYVSSIKTSEKGYQTLRAKMNKSGRCALQLYGLDKEKRAHPDTWRGCQIRPRLVFKGLWLMGKDMGALLELTRGLLQEESSDERPL